MPSVLGDMNEFGSIWSNTLASRELIIHCYMKIVKRTRFTPEERRNQVVAAIEVTAHYDSRFEAGNGLTWAGDLYRVIEASYDASRSFSYLSCVRQ